MSKRKLVYLDDVIEMVKDNYKHLATLDYENAQELDFAKSKFYIKFIENIDTIPTIEKPNNELSFKDEYFVKWFERVYGTETLRRLNTSQGTHKFALKAFRAGFYEAEQALLELNNK